MKEYYIDEINTFVVKVNIKNCYPVVNVILVDEYGNEIRRDILEPTSKIGYNMFQFSYVPFDKGIAYIEALCGDKIIDTTVVKCVEREDDSVVEKVERVWTMVRTDYERL